MKSGAVFGLLLLCSVAVFSQTLIQAEDAALFSAYVRQQHLGYNGSGYVKVDTKTGAYMEFVFRRTTAVTDTVLVRYANGGSSRNFAVTINGTSVGSFGFGGTGGWTTWSNRVIVVPLQAGINKLRFTTTTNTTTYPVVDQITVQGQAAVTMFGLTLTKSGNGSVSASPVAAYHDAGTSVELTATPAGASFFSRWMGGNDSPASPYNLLMNGHKTVVGVFMDTTGRSGFTLESSPRGFASVNALGNNGTTGGAGGDEVTVTTGDDLWNLMLLRADANRSVNHSPLTVYVAGTLTPGPAIGSTKMLSVKDAYDISIIGVGQDATISGFGLNVVRSINIIVRGLKFTNIPDDGLSVEADDDEATGHHIWIDHCTFVPPGYDGALDITHTAAYVTASWNHFERWNKNSLVGHSDNNPADVNLKVTYHHNYFDSTSQRNPRVRFGKVHVFNNYYRKNALYGVSSNMEADVLVEGNYFVDVPIPTETSRDGSPPGDLVERSNIFVNCGTPGTRGTAFEPSTFYSYALDSASTIPQTVSKYAGSGIYDFSFNGNASVYTLTVNATNGTVTKNPDQPTYAHGTNVQLTATPSPGYYFVNWSGDVPPSLAASNPLTITMDGNKTVTANFTNQLHTLSITAVNGTVTKIPDLPSYPQGSSVQLTATPSGGYFFVSWTGDIPSGHEADNPLTLVMDANKNLTANFSNQTFTLTTNAVNGSITRNPNQAAYNNGATVELTAVPDVGYHFVNWSGDTSGSANPVSIVMNSNKNVTANFAINQYTLAITAANGSVTKNPDQATYDHGTNVLLTAMPNGGYNFSGWTGDASGTANPLNVLMNANKSITANFASVGLIASSNGTGGGAWSSAGTWAGGVVPTASHNVVIAAGDSVYVASAVSCSSLTVQTDATLSTTAVITVSGLFSLEADALYYHGASASPFVLPGATRFVDDASTVIYNFTGGSTDIAGGTFGNLILMRGSNNTKAIGALTINGDLTLSMSSATAGFRGTSGAVSLTHNVHGNVYIYGGTMACIDNGTGTAVGTWNIDGNVLVSGTSDSRIGPFSSGGASSVTGVYNIGGDLSIAGGRLHYATNSSTFGLGIFNLEGDLHIQSGSTITNSGSSGPFALNFVGSGVQIVNLGMNFSMGTNISDTVKSGSTVVFDTTAYTWGSTAGTLGRFVVDGSLELKGNAAIAGTGGFQLNPGATLKIGSPDGISESGTLGNVRVSGTRVFSQEARYEYAGAEAQATGTSLPATVDGLAIANPDGVTLTSPVTVTGTLLVDDGDLDMNGNTITLGPTGLLSETPGNTVTGATGSITTTRVLNAPAAGVDIGGLGVHIGSSANLGSTVITRGHAVQAAAGNGSIARYFDIIPTTNTGLNATIVLKYDESELNGNPENVLSLFKSTDTGTSWLPQGGAINPAANTITLPGVNDFSRWTAAEGAAIAAVTVSPGLVNFGNVVVGQTVSDTVTVSSVGSATLHIDSLRVYGGEFSLVSTIPDSLSTGNDGLIAVIFNPDSIGAQSGVLVLYSDAPTSPDTVGLSGTGISSTVSLSVPISAGWNMVSNPVFTPADSVRNLFPTSSLEYAFAFQAGAGYQQQYRLINGAGYWAKFPAGGSSSISGTIITLDTLPVNAGWNMVGSISAAVDTNSITWWPVNNKASLYYGYANGYISTDSLKPGKAYWVKANASGYLILPSTGSIALREPGINPFEGFNTFTITDAGGASQTLYLRDQSGTAPLDMFELPPPAPEGAFDVRFSSNRMLEEVKDDGERIPIDMSSVVYPITVSWKLVDGERPYTLAADGAPPQTLAGTGQMTITDAGVHRLTVGKQVTEQPSVFSLMQNYPNPFNPQTQIRFSVASEARTNLAIFNLLGQEVRTLFSDVARPGQVYDVTLDASGMASGVYFYQLRSGSMTEVRKLMIMK